MSKARSISEAGRNDVIWTRSSGICQTGCILGWGRSGCFLLKDTTARHGDIIMSVPGLEADIGASAVRQPEGVAR